MEDDLSSGEEILCGWLDPGSTLRSAFVDQHRERFGVEPISRTLGVSASAYYQRGKVVLSDRRREDALLLERIPGRAPG